MLTGFHVENFKSLRELDVEFGRLTVIVGPNGCGKSSVLEAIELLRDVLAVNHGPQIGPDFPAGAITRDYASDRSADAVDMRLSFDPPRGELVAHLVPLAEYPNVIDIDRSTLRAAASDELKWTPPNPNRWHPSDLSPWLERALTHIKLYQLDRRVIARPSYSDASRPELGPCGDDLASVLDAMQCEHREHFEAIEDSLRSFVDGLERIRLRRVQVPITRTINDGQSFRNVNDTGLGHQVILDFDFAKSIAAERASEGTILLLGLLTAIGAEPGPPTTIMLDDLDRGLHPRAQRDLIGHLHALLERRPEVQLLATTHSPYLVEHLAYDEVLAMTRAADDGRSLIAPLADHPDAARWREEMSAGEFWSSVGETWLTGAGS